MNIKIMIGMMMFSFIAGFGLCTIIIGGLWLLLG